jgi:hypothetical protein
MIEVYAVGDRDPSGLVRVVSVGVKDLRRRVWRRAIRSDDYLRPYLIDKSSELFFLHSGPFATKMTASDPHEIRLSVRDDGVFERIERVTDGLEMLFVRVARNVNELAMLNQTTQNRDAQADQFDTARASRHDIRSLAPLSFATTIALS